MSSYTFLEAKRRLSERLKWLDKLDNEKWARVRVFAERRFQKTFNYPLPTIVKSPGTKISETLAIHLLDSAYVAAGQKREASFVAVYDEARLLVLLDFAGRVRNRYTSDERRRELAVRRKTIELTKEGAAALEFLVKKLNCSNSVVIESMLLDTVDDFTKHNEQMKKSKQAIKESKERATQLQNRVEELEAELKLKKMTLADREREVQALKHNRKLDVDESYLSEKEQEAIQEHRVFAESVISADVEVGSSNSPQQRDDGVRGVGPITKNEGPIECSDDLELIGPRGAKLEQNVTDRKKVNRRKKGFGR
ncbi:hypothetical protein FM042_09285 [Aliidiomarina halalkaliphila]|uniref:Uncharacterized protein n=1 Tax=Aliidiomarina halalkaliphila TaxID=2593535 RepID=A0A552X192_9GAMM|nr:hypothetical protein [Aliidiomarina halalkaliphila]TRW48363.1 hypothetical protein FM042_09285 [Aliidiomarina halalkaliphila]